MNNKKTWLHLKLRIVDNNNIKQNNISPVTKQQQKSKQRIGSKAITA